MLKELLVILSYAVTICGDNNSYLCIKGREGNEVITQEQ